ncbi:MAG: YicC family protein [Acidobacteria bacterium RIFCSPLOWO2_12_FULL_67_14]|nr:MAG: YicC family protein [Acidobacteria bacterium RIFCSPLOWO2_02_FULL_67_21]OFW36172.1 MAG: YicC family protein [Acidobacteria bacterium RIFCSPLOWO2_12_FULL_67_14]
MIKSMTGFASLTHEDERATIGITIRAVNHRFLDVQLRSPQSLAGLEPRIRAVLQKRLARGRVELAIAVQLRSTVTPTVELNAEFAQALSAALDQARARGLISGALTPGDLLRLPQAVTIRDRGAETDPAVEAHLAASVEAAVEQALADLDAMRVREGEHLRADFEARLRTLAGLAEALAAAADRGRTTLEQRLQERIRELTFELPVDQAMIAQEIIRVAGRSDISEELTRFRAHLAHWEALQDADEPCGRKLDFLLQEMNREVNTIGAKADGLQVSQLIINGKAELEKLREQVQNVE